MTVSNKCRSLAPCLFLLGLVGGWSSSVSGQTAPDPVNTPRDALLERVTQANQKFAEARQLNDLGQFDRACVLFEESQQLDPSPGTLLNIGNCREHKHQLLEALVAFQQAKADASVHANKTKRRLWLDAVEGRISGLVARIPTLQLQRSATAGAQVLLNGQAFSRYESAMPLEPGLYKISLSASGYEPATRSVELREGQHLALELPVLRAIALAVEVSLPPSATRMPLVSEESLYGSTPRWLLGAGGLLAASGVVTGLLTLSNKKRLEALCDGNSTCPEGYLSTKRTGKALALTTDILFGTGAVAAGVGLTLLWLDSIPSHSENPLGPSVRLSPSCSSGSCGFVATGCF